MDGTELNATPFTGRTGTTPRLAAADRACQWRDDAEDLKRDQQRWDAAAQWDADNEQRRAARFVFGYPPARSQTCTPE
jgi:hypothetical protein